MGTRQRRSEEERYDPYQGPTDMSGRDYGRGSDDRGGYVPEGWAGRGNWYEGENWLEDYGRGYRSRRQPFEEREDEEIKNEIYDALDDEPGVPPNADLRVEVDDGVVTLTGSVRNRQAKFAAGDCAWHTRGVHDVHNNIAVTSRRREFRNVEQQPRGRKAA